MLVKFNSVNSFVFLCLPYHLLYFPTGSSRPRVVFCIALSIGETPAWSKVEVSEKAVDRQNPHYCLFVTESVCLCGWDIQVTFTLLNSPSHPPWLCLCTQSVYPECNFRKVLCSTVSRSRCSCSSSNNTLWKFVTCVSTTHNNYYYFSYYYLHIPSLILPWDSVSSILNIRPLHVHQTRLCKGYCWEDSQQQICNRKMYNHNVQLQCKVVLLVWCGELWE